MIEGLFVKTVFADIAVAVMHHKIKLLVFIIVVGEPYIRRDVLEIVDAKSIYSAHAVYILGKIQIFVESVEPSLLNETAVFKACATALYTASALWWSLLP